MKILQIRFLIAALLVCVVSISPAMARKALPEVNDEGMELVKNSKLATVYADPDADLGIYNRIWLLDATVAFKKNWKREQNRSYPLKVKDKDMLVIEEDISGLFREVFTEELLAGGYELTTEAGEDVLKILPAIVDLDVHAPDIRSNPGRTYTFSESAGEMTLNLELFDSVTGDKIAKATDRKRDFQRGYLEWRTSVSNRATAKRMMRSWAKALREALDEARATTSGK